jgi:hypothetical protein
VIAGDREVKADSLGVLNVADQLVGRGLLGHHRVSEFGHGVRLPDALGDARIRDPVVPQSG